MSLLTKYVRQNSGLILGLLLVIPTLLPLFHEGFFKTHDYTHVARLVELDVALRDGHFPARLSRDLGWGYGMPLFQFYAPLPYYLAELVHLFGFDFVTSIKVITGFTAFLGFISMFVLAHKFWGKWGGVLAAVAFVYSPYRAVDLYVRGALSELFAISLVPLVLWAITQVVDKQTKKYVSIGALVLGAFLLSHTVLNLISVPVFGIFAGVYWLIKRGNGQKLMRLAAMFALGLGAASFFLVPAFWEKQYAQVDKLTSGYSHYGHHFLYFRQFLGGQWGYGGSVDGIEDGLSFHLGKMHLLLVGLTVLVLLTKVARQKRLKPHHGVAALFVALSVGLAALSTYHAKPIWDAIPLMAFIQFPWRFNSLLIVFIAFLTGGSVYGLAKISQTLAVILLIGAVGLLLQVNFKYFKPEEYVDADALYYTDQTKIREALSGVIPDYIPIWVEKPPQAVASQEYTVLTGNPSISTLKSATQLLQLSVSNPKETRLQINRFYFPGWRVFLDGEEIPVETQHTGLMTVTLPSGNHTLEAAFGKTPIRFWSEVISVASFIAIGYVFSLKPNPVRPPKRSGKPPQKRKQP